MFLLYHSSIRAELILTCVTPKTELEEKGRRGVMTTMMMMEKEVEVPTKRVASDHASCVSALVFFLNFLRIYSLIIIFRVNALHPLSDTITSAKHRILKCALM